MSSAESAGRAVSSPASAEKPVLFQGDGRLEGRFGWPPDEPSSSTVGGRTQPVKVEGGVVVAHPYPPNDANMDLPVVYHIAKACRARRMATLRFNFRSVGESAGSFSGTEEYQDVIAAAGFMREQLARDDVHPSPGTSLGLAGWSFGSVMAARAAADIPGLKALALVGFVPRWEHFPADTLERLGHYRGPLLAICAEHDEMGAPADVERVLADLASDYQVEVISDADHYLLGRHREVAELVAGFFARTLSHA